MGERTGGVLKRRGLLAGAAALVGAGLEKLTGPDRARAAHIASDESIIHAAAFNSTTAVTTISTTGASAFSAFSDGGHRSAGVRGAAMSLTFESYGVDGETQSPTTNASGVKGLAVRGVTNGVWGENTSPAPNATGVFGLAFAASSVNVGVWGRTQSTAAGAVGVFGEAPATSGTGSGMYGRAQGGIGVRGDSTDGTGVYGRSQSGVGIFAESVSSTGAFAAGARGVWGRTPSGIGVLAQATQGGTVQNRSFGLYAAAPGPGWAGYFEGNVYVTGQFIQAGNAPATSTAQVSDGSTRALYSQDSTEPVVEDFGEAKLAVGRFEVTLDPHFAAIADGDAYQVFLTPYADCNGLAVMTRGPGGFTVAELRAGTSGVGFGYRVVAKRRGAAGKRLERIERPRGLDAKGLEPPKLPEDPPAPERPTEPRPESPRAGRQEAR